LIFAHYAERIALTLIRHSPPTDRRNLRGHGSLAVDDAIIALKFENEIARWAIKA
jgi:hypothetical protein